MVRSNRLFLIAVIIGVIAIAGFLALEFLPLNSQSEVPSVSSNNQQTVVPEATGKVDDLTSSLEKNLYEEAAVAYEEDQDINTVNSDSEELNSMAASTDGAGIQ